MDTQSEQNLIILLFSAALLPPKPTFERLIPVNFLLAQLVIKKLKTWADSFWSIVLLCHQETV